MERRPPDTKARAGAEPRLRDNLAVEIAHTVEDAGLGPRDSDAEPEESIDPGGHEPFTTGHIHRWMTTVDHHGPESGTPSLDRGGEPGRPAADDEHLGSLNHDG
jgi:hypothetical protein